MLGALCSNQPAVQSLTTYRLVQHLVVRTCTGRAVPTHAIKKECMHMLALNTGVGGRGNTQRVCGTIVVYNTARVAFTIAHIISFINGAGNPRGGGTIYICKCIYVLTDLQSIYVFWRLTCTALFQKTGFVRNKRLRICLRPF